MSKGKVAPNADLDWYRAEVQTVLNGDRPMGASLEDRLTVKKTRKLVYLVQQGRLTVMTIKHKDGTFEWAWAQTNAPLVQYRAVQISRSFNNITDRVYWDATATLFGYSTEDVDAFVTFQTKGEGCDCAQCFPAGPPTWR